MANFGSKVTQVLKLEMSPSYKWTVEAHWEQPNPFYLYRHYVSFDGSSGYHSNHKRLVAKYANIASCTAHLTDELNNRIWFA